jgi:hypothetical protein
MVWLISAAEAIVGVMNINGRWPAIMWKVNLVVSTSLRLHHYSTALSTRVARAVVNIAIRTQLG